MSENKKRSLESPDNNQQPKLSRKITSKKVHQFGDLTTMFSQTQFGDSQQNLLDPMLVAALRVVVSEEMSKQFEQKQKTLQDFLVKELDSRLTGFATKTEVTTLSDQCQTLSNLNATFQDKIDDLEIRSRKKNLIFSNVVLAEDVTQCIQDLCKDKLGMESINFNRVVKLKHDTTKKTMMVLVEFVDEQTVNNIFKRVNRLKNSNIGVASDLPQRTREAKNILLKLRREILKKDTSTKVKVFNNNIYIDNVKLTLTSNDFGNKQTNGKVYIRERFNIDFDTIVSNNMNVTNSNSQR